ncbi:uracil phosphoribosyltransferase-domain-containing protein [Aspergillus pseudonomiae]|uniref:Uracil phosphoribosyltransferase-domain-containing protein n=1 Tax=Aspergillus pseudonomiae TaxID=1506151 RepID=A0A5N7DL95_9EURO|nr:uracil phosphoribosyltransferase-domain-containing protein [Aspergillus pseudonomiae]KAB8260221.1 uracil phosphoribosyltransferase-domain-containing protein [Aspergillus pseudonomiae]KAE8407222.1 uracil phosphoribosyltransferase-domain-containing protein [Aspergillus pseudonomiae]
MFDEITPIAYSTRYLSPSCRSTMAQSPSSLSKPVVVGIYGIPGAGKTTLLNQLRMALGEDHFMYFKGSEEIDKLVCGGITSFKRLDDKAHQVLRELAINCIRQNCLAYDKTGVVTDHLMFWDEGNKCGSAVYTQSDLDTYTHVIYLDVPPEEIVKRRLDDPGGDRSHVSIAHVRRWMEAEKQMLRDLCYRNNILFCSVSPDMIPKDVENLLHDFSKHDERHNLSNALSTLDSIPAIQSGTLKRMIVLDADGTLTSQDTGALFWKIFPPLLGYADGDWSKTPARVVFESPLGYSYNAFRQVTLLHEERLRDNQYDFVCREVASSITMDEEFVTLLYRIAEQNHVAAVVVTSGLALIWKYVLEMQRLLGKVAVIGGGRISDGFAVTLEVKEALVDHLKTQHRLVVWAFGDSPLDLKMLCKADKAFVVVKDEATRSHPMERALKQAIETGGLKAEQCLRPCFVTPRLNKEILPEVKLLDPTFVDSLLSDGTKLNVISAEKLNPEAVKILMTPMRNANVQGPRLREAHREVGRYLAYTFLPTPIGVKEVDNPHPQGHNTTGYQLRREDKILIVALMRGEEPMAFGVNDDACQRAMFVHAKQPSDLQDDLLKDTVAVILVDSVVNSGATIQSFLEHIRSIKKDAPVAVLTGVIQVECASGGRLTPALTKHRNVQFITLRISENKYKGTGGHGYWKSPLQHSPSAQISS